MAAAGFQPNDTAKVDASSTPTWPRSYYALIEEPGSGRYGDRLALCTAHQPPCIRHGSDSAGWWCQRLPPHRERPYPAAPGNSPEPSSRTITVQLDAAELGRAVAEGVVLGFRVARAEERAERRR